MKHLQEQGLGFYPCFNGIRVLTAEREILSIRETTVSILVLMESGFLPSAGIWILKDALRFLSLF